MIGMVFGLILELLGYIARVMLHNNPFDGNSFLLYISLPPKHLSQST